MADCYSCKKQCPFHPSMEAPENPVNQRSQLKPPERPFIVAVAAGGSCQDFAQYGLRWCFVGDHMEEWILFSEEMCLLKPDVLWLEITATCPAELHGELAEKLGLGFMTGIETPKSRGVPIRRQRRFSFAYSKKKFMFSGSWDDYDETFKRAPKLSGDCFVMLDSGERQKLYREMGENKKLYFSAEKIISVEDVLTIPQQCRLKQHEEFFNSDSYLHDAYITDLNHEVSFTTGDQYVPCLTAHCKLIASLSKDGKHKIFHPRELLMVQGEPCFQSCSPDDYPRYWQDILENGSVPSTAMCSMIGNSFNAVSFGLFVIYCLANLRLKPEA